MLRHDERGETLVEVMITVVVISIAVVGIISGIATSARASTEHREVSSGAIALVAAAEAIEGFTPSSGTCGTITASTYSGALSSVTGLPAGWSTSNLSIASASCATVAGSSLPHVVVRATPPDGAKAMTLEVVRRSVP